MDLFTAILGRRSIRKFKDRPIADGDLEKILNAARWAPNGGNANSWRFVVVTSPAHNKQLLYFCPGINQAPAATIVVCVAAGQGQIKEKTRLWLMADCAIAAQNICLAAYSLNIGSCIVASFADIALREILDLPEHVEPQLIVTLGYADEDPEPPDRLPISDVAFRNNYGEGW